jgi:hypothetical protein
MMPFLLPIAEWETYAPFSAWVDLGWVDLCLVPG